MAHSIIVARTEGMVCQRRKNTRMGITAKYVGNTRQMKNFQGKRPCDPYMQILLTFKRN